MGYNVASRICSETSMPALQLAKYSKRNMPHLVTCLFLKVDFLHMLLLATIWHLDFIINVNFEKNLYKMFQIKGLKKGNQICDGKYINFITQLTLPYTPLHCEDLITAPIYFQREIVRP